MRTPTARIAIGIAAAIGLSVLARTAAYYPRQDSLSLALVAIMTAAFVTGVVELLQRAARAERLAREIAALPVPATQATIDGASPPVRALLRARLAQVPSAAPAAPIASYLVGLLVMLGLLGTFLGLLETLRGAREALAASGDIEALRAGLSLPMQGLTRSFGTSAAGVSASAMLGLAATFARRSEARLAQTASAYAAEALAPLTLAHRQLAALERIAQQGDALPEASLALRACVANLAALETSWTRAHAEAADHSARALSAAVESVRADLAGAIDRSAQAASRVLAPLVERAVATTDRITRAASDAVDGATLRMTAAGDRDEARGAALDRLAAAMDAQREALASATEKHVASVEAMLRAIDARAEANDAEIARAHATYAGELREAAALVHAGGAELTAVAEMFAGAVDRHRDAATAWLEGLGGVEAAMDQASESLAARGFGEQLDRARELFDVQLQFHREILLRLRTADGAEREESVGDAPA